MLDGPVDAIWIENLNTVLDDNKLLTLPNGERLNLPPNVRVMFEVESLKYATLATVSRCGMVWFSDDIVRTDMIVSNYLSHLRDVPFEPWLSDALFRPLNRSHFHSLTNQNKTQSENESVLASSAYACDEASQTSYSCLVSTLYCCDENSLTLARDLERKSTYSPEKMSQLLDKDICNVSRSCPISFSVPSVKNAGRLAGS